MQKLLNKIVDLEKEKGASSSRKPFKPYYKKREESGKTQPPLLNFVVLNFNEVGMDNLCTFHQENHSKLFFAQWINSMNLAMNQLLDAQLTDPEKEEYQTNEHEETIEETTMVLWYWTPTLGLNEEEHIEEIQVSPVNVTMRSKGSVVDQSLVFA